MQDGSRKSGRRRRFANGLIRRACNAVWPSRPSTGHRMGILLLRDPAGPARGASQWLPPDSGDPSSQSLARSQLTRPWRNHGAAGEDFRGFPSSPCSTRRGRDLNTSLHWATAAVPACASGFGWTRGILPRPPRVVGLSGARTSREGRGRVCLGRVCLCLDVCVCVVARTGNFLQQERGAIGNTWTPGPHAKHLQRQTGEWESEIWLTA